jgi:uncharacterized protein YbaP (TraB family)
MRGALDSIGRNLCEGTSKIKPFPHVKKVEEPQPEICLLFFRVKGNKIHATQKVYLLGTNHAVKAHQYPEWVLKDIQNCDLLVSEFEKELVTGDPHTMVWLRNAETLLTIQTKLIPFDEEWFKVHLPKVGYDSENSESVISMLKEKSNELMRDRTNWLSHLSEETQMQIQQHLNDSYGGLKIEAVDPFFVESSLGYAAGNEMIDTDTGEIVILQNFKDRDRPIINWESKDELLVMFLQDFLKDISSYSLEDSLNSIQNMLVGKFEEEHDSPEKYIDLVNNCMVHDLASFKESLKKDDEIPAMIYRNIVGFPKIISGINQGKDTAIILGARHLMGATGVINSLEERGYCVEHAVKL